MKYQVPLTLKLKYSLIKNLGLSLSFWVFFLSNHSPFICDQNIRGGKVVLHSILTPPSEFEHVEKGDALYGMCLDSFSLLEIAFSFFLFLLDFVYNSIHILML